MPYFEVACPEPRQLDGKFFSGHITSLSHPPYCCILNDPALFSLPPSCTRLKEPVPTAYPIWGDVFPVPRVEILNTFPTESLLYFA